MKVNQKIYASLRVYEFPEFCTNFHQPYNHYSLDHLIGLAGNYPMDCDSSAGLHCPWDQYLSN